MTYDRGRVNFPIKDNETSTNKIIGEICQIQGQIFIQIQKVHRAINRQTLDKFPLPPIVKTLKIQNKAY